MAHSRHIYLRRESRSKLWVCMLGYALICSYGIAPALSAGSNTPTIVGIFMTGGDLILLSLPHISESWARISQAQGQSTPTKNCGRECDAFGRFARWGTGRCRKMVYVVNDRLIKWTGAPLRGLVEWRKQADWGFHVYVACVLTGY